ncbi:MAG: flavodoxin family protein [Candidatus Latescibacteria bacterium]|nr:flavodoxin family protein [Candidatus Latescibacterota bacterium]
MKILAINGSMRKKGNTNRLIEITLQACKDTVSNLDVKTLQIADLRIDPCRADYNMCSKSPFVCSNQQDDFQTVLDEMKSADAILIGAPLYLVVPARLCALLERLGELAFFNDEMRKHDAPSPLADKPCGFIAVCYIDSPLPVLEQLHKIAVYLEMKPVNLGTFPFLGVAGRDDLDKDTYYQPIEKSKRLGSLLANSLQSV